MVSVGSREINKAELSLLSLSLGSIGETNIKQTYNSFWITIVVRVIKKYKWTQSIKLSQKGDMLKS